MCGRYSAAKDPAKLAAEFDAVALDLDAALPADFNVAPTKRIVTVVTARDEPEHEPVRALRVMRWGLVPFWAKEAKIGAKMINARAETAATKPAFKTSLSRRRCLLPADGWYEWRRDGTVKQPFYMTPSDGSSLAMAGLWSSWHDKADPEAEPLVTAAVLTTDSVGKLTDIHDRMPLLLPARAWRDWLDPDLVELDALADLLVPPSMEVVDAIELRPVSTAVNSVRNNGPELVERVDPAPEGALFDPDPADR